MKKIILSLTVGLTAILLSTSVFASQKATVFHPYTGERKVVEVGTPNVFDGGWILETKEVNYISYWVTRLTNENAKPITDEELDLIPEEAWYQITPQIINEVPNQVILGGDGQPEVVNISVCRGDDCLLYQKDPLLGYSVATRYRTRLTSSITSTQSTVPVSSMSSFDGTTLTMALLGSKVFLSLEPGTAREEIVKCTGISSTTWTGCTRGLAFTGTTETAVVANQKAHNAGSIVVMSNVHYVYEQLTDKDTTETLTGQKFFDVFPEITGASLPTTTRQLATKGYVDNVGAGGFTASNIGGGLTIRANGTSPETIDINTSTPDLSFIIEEGKFEINTSTGSKVDTLWTNRLNATSTLDNFTIASTTLSGNLLIPGNATSTGTFVFEGDVIGVNREIRRYTCGEIITPNQAVYSSATSSRVLLTDADVATSTVNFLGFALGSCDADTNTQVDVQTGGIFTNSSASYTDNTIQYLSNTAGAISESVGTIEGIVGRAIGNTQIDMDIPKSWQFLESVNDVSDIINVKPQAKYAIVDVSCVESGGSFTSSQDITISRIGRTSGAFTDVGDATAGSDSIRCSAAWSGNTITLAAANDADAVSGTAYFYY